MGLAVGKEMAFRREVMRRVVKRGLILSVLAFLLLPAVVVNAALPTPILVDSKWRTGEIEVAWENAMPGKTMFLYTATYAKDGDYTLHDVWVPATSEGSYITQFLENGQTIWYYVRQYDSATDEWGPMSNIYKITPPITAFIINWPEMFGELAEKMQEMNDDLKDHLDGLFTPSDQAMNDLSNAVDGLKNALGAGAASEAGGALQSGLGGLQPGMHNPIGVDDGNGTYTGGNTGGNLPFTPGSNSGGGIELEGPNPDSGTSNALTIRIPYGVDMQGNLLYVKILTDEQLEKMKWLNLARNIAGAIIFIMFAFWLVARFSPQLKS